MIRGRKELKKERKTQEKRTERKGGNIEEGKRRKRGGKERKGEVPQGREKMRGQKGHLAEWFSRLSTASSEGNSSGADNSKPRLLTKLGLKLLSWLFLALPLPLLLVLLLSE